MFDSREYTTDDGFTVRVEYHYDYDAGSPWEHDEGHGGVRIVHAHYGRPQKRPGERVLHSDRWCHWLYDWQGACKKARAEGWNAKPYDAPARIERAVQADFDYLRGWLNDDWHYAGIIVTVCDATGVQPVDDACWGFETLNDYHETAGQEMADACLSRVRAEMTEREYWASRDVLTVGV